MDSKEFKGLTEAYAEVYSPQEEIEEAVKGETPERRKALAAERKAGIKPLSAKEGERYASHKMAQMAYVKRARMGEEVDIFDTVLEYLQTEGHENPEQMMTQLSSEEIDAILEATYSAKAARAGKDIGKPGKAFAKIAKEAGKRYGSKERGEKVAGAVLAKLRKQHEEVEIDEALTGERYKKVMNKPNGTAYSRKVSADPTKRATRGGRGGESDFGAGDRGSGNKAARRAGTYED